MTDTDTDTEVDTDADTDTDTDADVVVALPRTERLEVIDAELPIVADPTDRFVVRRTQVREKNHRRRRRNRLMALAVVLLLAAVVGAAFSPLLSVGSITVRGAERLSRDEVIDAAGLRAGQAMALIDTAEATRRLTDESWIERARVVRRWPRGIEVTVVERRPIAVVTWEQSAMVIVEGGLAVGPPPPLAEGERQGVPVVSIPASSAVKVGDRLRPLIRDAVAMVAAFPQSLASRVGSAAVTDAGEVEMTVGDKGLLQLGDATQAEAKFLSVKTMLSGAVALDCLQRLDLRVPADPRLERSAGCR